MRIVANRRNRDCRQYPHPHGERTMLPSARKQPQGQITGGAGASEKHLRSMVKPGRNVDGGSKSKRSVQRVILPAMGLLLLLSVSPACRRKAAAPPPAATTQPAAKQPPDSAPQAITPSVVPPAKAAPLEPAPAPKAVAAPNTLDLGIRSFRSGDYAKAAQLFEDYLRGNANSDNRDVALFHLFLSRRLAGNSAKNMRRAEEALKRLAADFPNSPYRDSAEYILGLQAQIENLKSDNREKDAKIKQLSDELQKLKEIDLQRRPSRPLY